MQIIRRIIATKMCEYFISRNFCATRFNREIAKIPLRKKADICYIQRRGVGETAQTCRHSCSKPDGLKSIRYAWWQWSIEEKRKERNRIWDYLKEEREKQNMRLSERGKRETEHEIIWKRKERNRIWDYLKEEREKQNMRWSERERRQERRWWNIARATVIHWTHLGVSLSPFFHPYLRFTSSLFLILLGSSLPALYPFLHPERDKGREKDLSGNFPHKNCHWDSSSRSSQCMPPIQSWCLRVSRSYLLGVLHTTRKLLRARATGIALLCWELWGCGCSEQGTLESVDPSYARRSWEPGLERDRVLFAPHCWYCLGCVIVIQRKANLKIFSRK